MFNWFVYFLFNFENKNNNFKKLLIKIKIKKYGQRKKEQFTD